MYPFSLEGQTLGKYRVLEPLGRGGMARVYRAYHAQLDRYVAVKVMRPDLMLEGAASDVEAWHERFRREAQAVARLRHPNIVQVYDFDVQDDIYYMVMELLEGNTLKAYLNDHRRRSTPMSFGEICRVMLDVLAGLAYAHSEGVIHRDIKPGNVMLTRRGQAVVTDFGIAQIVGGTQHTVTGALMGTLDYMAPEQGLEGRSDARGDIYSLGIVLYEMLTQRTPFDADTPLAILMKHLNDPLPLPRQINPDIPEALERIVLKALAKQPADRYASAGDMAQMIRESGIEIPAEIACGEVLPEMAALSDSVVVLSGKARDEIVDPGFARDDTAPTPVQTSATDEDTPESTRPPKPLRELDLGFVQMQLGIGQAILGALALLIAGNLGVVLFAGSTNQWRIFHYIWPIELLLSSLGLCIVMNVGTTVWMLIPCGILLGNGALFAYYAVTGNWHHWSFFWPIEPLIILLSVVGAIWLAGRGAVSRRASLVLSWVMGLSAIGWCIMLSLASVVAMLFAR